MKLTLIAGGLSAAPADPSLPDKEAVRAEAARRIAAIGYEQAAVRQFMTGLAVPRRLVALRLQIAYAGEALCRLDPIPADFRDDGYWPRPD